MSKKTPRREILSIELMGQILKSFLGEEDPISLSALAKKNEVSPARIYPYMVSLLNGNFIRRNDEGNYSIGQLIKHLGLLGFSLLDPIDEIAYYVDKYNAESQNAIMVCTWGTFGPSIIRFKDAKVSFYSEFKVGTVLALEDSAPGMVFSAFLSENIIVDTTKNNPIIKDIKKRGYLIKENWPGPLLNIDSISVPIFGFSKNIDYVITVFIRDAANINDHLDEVLRLQQVITKKLGHN